MEARLELGAVVGLDNEDSEGQAPKDFIDKSDGGGLVARVADLKHPNPRAIVDRGELKQPFLGAGDPLEEFHVQLQPVAWLRLLVALPPFLVRPVRLMAGSRLIP
jgi:hypothetical protein